MRRVLVLALLALGVLAAPARAEDVVVDVEIPQSATGPFEVDDARLVWGINAEVGGGAFFGGCNFLSAGKVGDAGGSHVWQDGSRFRGSAGAVTVERPVQQTSKGLRYRPVTWQERCTDAHGRTVSSASLQGTGVRFVVDGGTGSVDPAKGSARIAWKGSVSVVFYGGLTYWWFSDPVLELRAGSGTLTAVAGGFGAAREDSSLWRRLPEERVVLAELRGVSLSGAKGFTVTPEYRGVRVDVPADAPPQVRSGADWGSFPQSFVDFHAATGQQAFWYSSGGARDGAKPASPLTVSYEASDPAEPPAPEDLEDEAPQEQGGGTPRNRVAAPPVRRPPSAAPSVPQAVAATVPVMRTETVLPARAAPAATLATTGGTPRGAVAALAALLLGSALTVLGYRHGLLVRPGRRQA